MADPELPDLQQAAAYAVHREQHGHPDLRAGQVQPQRQAVLGVPRPGVQQRLVRLSVSGRTRRLLSSEDVPIINPLTSPEACSWDGPVSGALPRKPEPVRLSL